MSVYDMFVTAIPNFPRVTFPALDRAVLRDPVVFVAVEIVKILHASMETREISGVSH
jgi:hypothetical protein